MELDAIVVASGQPIPRASGFILFGVLVVTAAVNLLLSFRGRIQVSTRRKHRSIALLSVLAGMLFLYRGLSGN